MLNNPFHPNNLKIYHLDSKLKKINFQWYSFSAPFHNFIIIWASMSATVTQVTYGDDGHAPLTSARPTHTHTVGTTMRTT